MNQQDNVPAATTTAAPPAQEFYLPRGGGIDPDLYVPEDRVHEPGRLSRWISALPGFGRQQR